MKGKLSHTGLMILESEEVQWRLFTRGIISEFRTTAVVHKSPTEKMRLKLIVESIFCPEHLIGEFSGQTISNIEVVSLGFSRIQTHFFQHLSKSMWLFAGYIENEERNIPILFCHFQEINITVYTLKLAKKETEKFFPQMN